MLVTSGTVTSAAMMSQRLPAGALHQFVPLDTPGAVARFLDHWKPDAGLFVESDLWPNLILAARARGVKLALVNARISARSAERWTLGAAAAWRILLSAFDMVLAQDEEIAERFRALGARNVEVVGSLKADAPPLTVDEDALAAMRQAIGGRPVLLAAQTHPGEDETILPAHDQLRAQFPDLLTILVPRHTARGSRSGDAVRRSRLPAPLCRRPASPARPPSISPTRWARWACSIACRLSAFWAARWCRWAGTIRWSPRCCIAPSWRGRIRPAHRRAYEAIFAAQGFGRVTSSADIAREAARLLADANAARRGRRCGGARRGHPVGRGGRAPSTQLEGQLLDARA